MVALGGSPVSEAFGASIGLFGSQPPGLYYLVTSGSPAPVVRALSGRTVVELGRDKALALLSMEGFHSALRDPNVRLVGSVTVDPDRFSRFMELIGSSGA